LVEIPRCGVGGVLQDFRTAPFGSDMGHYGCAIGEFVSFADLGDLCGIDLRGAVKPLFCRFMGDAGHEELPVFRKRPLRLRIGIGRERLRVEASIPPGLAGGEQDGRGGDGRSVENAFQRCPL